MAAASICCSYAYWVALVVGGEGGAASRMEGRGSGVEAGIRWVGAAPVSGGRRGTGEWRNGSPFGGWGLWRIGSSAGGGEGEGFGGWDLMGIDGGQIFLNKKITGCIGNLQCVYLS
jgi:hypothetical protein